MRVKTARLSCASEFLASRRRYRVAALIAALAIVASANVYAVLHPPFPVRAMPPSHGHWALIGNDSTSAWPRAQTPARSR
ncbi:MAG: hypothetical protein DME86_03310 [Verrucomicrobia bacterium]|nr:MAG: hypothetical protein DME86_03310 [Verrucomicrobiota bacterium]